MELAGVARVRWGFPEDGITPTAVGYRDDPAAFDRLLAHLPTVAG